MSTYDDMRKKYEKIDKLNAAWSADYASWDALFKSTTPPDAEQARAALEGHLEAMEPEEKRGQGKA